MVILGKRLKKVDELLKKICFVAQFPPPIHGLSKAVDTLYNSNLNKEFELHKINITNNRCFLKNIFNFFKCSKDVVYITISQTKFGNIRDLFFIFCALLLKKKCVLHLHGGYFRNLVDNDLNVVQRKLNYYFVSKVDAVIVLGDSLKYIFQGMINSKRIFVVPNCVDNEFKLSNEDFKMKFKNKSEVKNVLFLSNFIEDKGYKRVLELAKFEKKRIQTGQKQSLNFMFAGNFFRNEDRDYFFDFIKKNQLNEIISYKGVVNGEAKYHLLMQSDILILLTSYRKEGQPISIIEAMSAGMMIVSTCFAGIPDIVKNGENGYLVEKNINVEELHKLIVTANYKGISKCNRLKIEKNFSEIKYIKNMKNIFKLVSED